MALKGNTLLTYVAILDSKCNIYTCINKVIGDISMTQLAYISESFFDQGKNIWKIINQSKWHPANELKIESLKKSVKAIDVHDNISDTRKSFNEEILLPKCIPTQDGVTSWTRNFCNHVWMKFALTMLLNRYTSDWHTFRYRWTKVLR